jgi:hypothetical protein
MLLPSADTLKRVLMLNTIKKGTADFDLDANQVLHGLNEITQLDNG